LDFGFRPVATSRIGMAKDGNAALPIIRREISSTGS